LETEMALWNASTLCESATGRIETCVAKG